MAKVIVLRGRLDYILFALAVSGGSCCNLLPPALDNLRYSERLEDVQVQREKFERSKNYSHRADNFIPQQPKYHRQFGNGGISGRVPYHLKRERHLYRSKF